MKSLEELDKEAVYKVLDEYFRVLENDGLLEPHSVIPNDIEFLSNRVIDAISNSRIIEYERQCEADLLTREHTEDIDN